MTYLPYFLIDSLESLKERDANADEHLLLGFLDRFRMPLLFETCTHTEHETVSWTRAQSWNFLNSLWGLATEEE
jgi:hypothetical protein